MVESEWSAFMWPITGAANAWIGSTSASRYASGFGFAARAKPPTKLTAFKACIR